MSGILLVDDEDGIRYTLQVLLRKAGFEVTSAASGAEAIAALKTGKFSVALIDWTLPDIDGKTLVGYVRFTYPSIAVLVHTGDIMLASDDPTVTVLQKPMEIGKLIETLRALTEKA